MTVRELIELLKKCPPEHEAMIVLDGQACITVGLVEVRDGMTCLEWEQREDPDR